MIHQSVLDVFPTVTAKLEGRVLWPYQDVKGLVTIGLGCLIEPVQLALSLPWEGHPSDSDVRHEWSKVNAFPPAMHFKQYERACSLRLSEAGVDALADSRVSMFEATLHHWFPAWDSFNADAQLALLLMSWALGPAFAGTFTNFARFVNLPGGPDWANAAKCAHMNEAGNVGLVPRNAQVALCLANAAASVEHDDLASMLHWPSAYARVADVPALHVVTLAEQASFSLNAHWQDFVLRAGEG